jgi:secondary thiamine-phosphate synthase enzyme
MKIHTQVHTLETGEGIEMINLDGRVSGTLADSGVSNGMVIISSRHTTTALTINEYEERLLQDVYAFCSRLVPQAEHYLHNDIALRDCPDDEPENAHSHIMAMLLSSSEVIPVVDSELQLGKWQSVILFELDGPRTRTVTVQVIGEGPA